MTPGVPGEVTPHGLRFARIVGEYYRQQYASLLGPDAASCAKGKHACGKVLQSGRPCGSPGHGASTCTVGLTKAPPANQGGGASVTNPRPPCLGPRVPRWPSRSRLRDLVLVGDPGLQGSRRPAELAVGR